MQADINRRELLKLVAAGGAATLGGHSIATFAARAEKGKLVSPGCRRSKVKVAKIYLGIPQSHYPTPELDLKKDLRFYESEFAKLKDELADVQFVVDELISSVDQLNRWQDTLKNADGILAIHLTLWTMPILSEILRLGRPTIVFSAPYSGHEWHTLSAIYKHKDGQNLECILSSDYTQLAAAVRPFRAIHHLREAKILNLTTGAFDPYAQEIRGRFGTEIKQIGLQRVLDACHADITKELQYFCRFKKIDMINEAVRPA